MGFLLPWIIASPISRYSGEAVLSEEGPEGWWMAGFSKEQRVRYRAVLGD